jgi:hypothetical protein
MVRGRIRRRGPCRWEPPARRRLWPIDSLPGAIKVVEIARQGCVSMRAARTAVRSLRYWSSRMRRLDSRNRPVAKRAPSMSLTANAASTIGGVAIPRASAR